MAPPSPHDAKVQAAWAAHRPYLLAVAAGMLKGWDDAEDVVQEACARLAASPGAIEDARGWLVVVIDDRLASGHHTISVPDHVFLPPRRSPNSPNLPLAVFASVQVDGAIYNFGIAPGQ